VLVFAKTPEALNGLKHIFDEHHLRRVYIAVLTGELPENAGTLTDKLVERKSLRMSVVREGSKAPKDVKGSKLAITHYRVLERLPGHTVVEVKLETGRRNQIRVQFAERGFPLLGDQVYGQPSELLDRQALHAELLGFRHPVTDETVTVSSPMPADMERALKALRTARRVVRAEAGITGEEGLYKPRITRTRKIERRKRAERYGEPEAAPRPARPRAADGDVRAARPTRAPRTSGDARPARSPRPVGEGRPARSPRPAGEGRPVRAPRPAGENRPARSPRPAGEDRPARSPRPAGEDRPARAPKAAGEGRPPRAAGSGRPTGTRRAPVRPKGPARKG
jgi:23S rRNA pseudouridine1911/1915/1917 synthase